MRYLELAGGGRMPVLGLGTWKMGESASRRAAEVSAIRSAIDIGYRLIDTAEMYGEGGAEEVVGQALAEALRAGDVKREDLFIVSKAYPHNASRSGVPKACARSLARLGLDRLDLYLLHWRGEHPLADTRDAMRALVAEGRIGRWGVSNLDTDDMEELAALGDDCAANQVYYSAAERGPEFSLLPWQRARGMPMMAYSPIDQGALAADAGLQKIAQQLGATAAQLALAWVLAQPGVAAIPKAVRESHLRDNFAAAGLALGPELLAEIDRLHPAPRRKRPLAMI
ncbi:aldo/keto reductase [Variovorax saccharolyticus]|uniref:aldo/keto reductase n=1 Tax=Variovorax saccharolyticus TaxID=3053516 RepID=UPI002578DD65|nr:aldo/keto reductase [Variovorax sp. J31P216]MDM0024475.1 aldo/keto reductase [Variovorax sp. J31P216]